MLAAIGGIEETTLLDVLTVHSFEPALQRSGVLRINLNVPYSAELGRRMDDRFGEGTGSGLERLMNGGFTFDDDSRIVRVLRSISGDADDGNVTWGDALDSLTTDDRWHFGRIDLNTAPAAVLRTLEGVDDELAEQLVRERGSLTSEERETPIWPLLRELLTGDAYQTIAGRVTNRTWIWQLRLAAGTVSVEEPDGPIESPVISDLPIDLAAPRPRIAALRDISGLEVGVRLLESRGELPEELEAATSPEPSEAAASSFESANPFLVDGGFFDSLESPFDERNPVFDADGPPSMTEEEAPVREPGGDSASNGGTAVTLPGGRWSPR